MDPEKDNSRPDSPAASSNSSKSAVDLGTTERPPTSGEKNQKSNGVSVKTQRRHSAENIAPLDDVEKNSKSAEASGSEDQKDDPFVVFWDGPADPANPQNWTSKGKWANVLVVSFITLVT